MIFLELEGITGNATAEGFDGQMVIENFSFGVGRNIGMQVGGMANREVGTPNVSEINFSHVVDSSTTSLAKAAMIDREGVKATVTFVNTGDELSKYLVYTLENVLVSSYSLTADGQGRAVENISLSFSWIEMNYTDRSEVNADANPQIFAYDLLKGKKG